MYVEVMDFIPAEYQLRLTKTLFESLLIRRLLSSSNSKQMAFSIFTVCFILSLLCWRYFLLRVCSICGRNAIVLMSDAQATDLRST